MSVRLTIGTSATPAEFEWLPCSIDTTGPCKRDQYFIVKNDDSTAASTPVVHLRGRNLKGTQTTLPPGYSLIHLQRGDSTLQGENLQTEWQTVSEANSCRVWEHDIVPCETTGRIRAMEWLKLAPSMHSPISVDAVEARLTEMARSSADSTVTTLAKSDSL